MRFQCAAIAAAVLLTPQLSRAQAYWQPTPTPIENAAREPWQVNGEAIYYQGAFYYPVGPTEFFDGNAMQRTGDYEGVPLYENRFVEPQSLLYVPVSRGQMRPYERLRYGVKGGTVGSRTGWFPIQRDVELSLGKLEPVPDRFRVTSGGAQWDWPEPVSAPQPPALMSLGGRQAPSVSPTAVIREVPRRETTNAGAFIELEGVRYFSSGKAVVNDPQRFSRTGELRGAALFRDARGDRRTVFVEVVPGGALAPYSRR